MMVGHVGTTELAAASFTINVFHIGMLFGIGITYGLTPLVGHSFSSGNTRELGSWLKNGVAVYSIFALVLCGVMSLAVPFMHHMGQREEVVRLAIPYYLIQVASLVPMLIFFSFKQFFEGIGNVKIAMVVTIISNLVNIGLNYLLIYGKFGFPALGLNGAGYATLISRIIMPVIFVMAIWQRKNFSTYFKTAFHAVIDPRKVKRIVSIGFPIGGQMVIEVLSFSLGAIMMGWISKEAIAGHQVAISMAAMTYMISFGLAAGTTIRVSHAFGDRNMYEIKHAIYASLHIVVIFMSTMGLSFILLRYFLPLAFTSDTAVIEVAASLLVVAAFFQIFDGIQVVLLGALRGMADVRIPMYAAFFSYIVVSLPVSYLLAFVVGMGYAGVWVGFVFGLSIAAVLFALRLRRLFRKSDF